MTLTVEKSIEVNASLSLRSPARARNSSVFRLKIQRSDNRMATLIFIKPILSIFYIHNVVSCLRVRVVVYDMLTCMCCRVFSILRRIVTSCVFIYFSYSTQQRVFVCLCIECVCIYGYIYLLYDDVIACTAATARVCRLLLLLLPFCCVKWS